MPDSNATPAPRYFASYRNAVDGQWRVTIPSAWRNADREQLFIRRKTDHLVIINQAEVDRFLAWADQFKGQALTDVLTKWGLDLDQAKIDSAGRLTLPSEWAKDVGIKDGQKAVLVGSVRSFQIWGEPTWDAQVAAAAARGAAILEGYDG